MQYTDKILCTDAIQYTGCERSQCTIYWLRVYHNGQPYRKGFIILVVSQAIYLLSLRRINVLHQLQQCRSLYLLVPAVKATVVTAAAAKRNKKKRHVT